MGVVCEQLSVRVLLTPCCVQVGWSLRSLPLCLRGELRWRHFRRFHFCFHLLLRLCRAYWIRRRFEPVRLALFVWYSRLRAARRSYSVVTEGSCVLSYVWPVVLAQRLRVAWSFGSPHLVLRHGSLIFVGFGQLSYYVLLEHR